jgi:AhpD family alkylhydroperoxidase
MTKIFAVHTKDSASRDGGQALGRLQTAIGVIPNLAATMAESPALLHGFLDLRERFAQTGFSGAEIQVLSLVSAYENRCGWCVAFHTAMALKEGVSRESVDLLREGKAPTEARLAALSDYARGLVQKRGNAGETGLQAFLSAGFSKQQALDVVMGLAFSLMANYAAHIADPPLDAFLEAHVWKG